MYVEEESAEPEEERTFVQNIRSWTINSSSASESPEYELDGTVKSKMAILSCGSCPALKLETAAGAALMKMNWSTLSESGKGRTGH